MTTLLQLQAGSKAFGAKILFDNATFTVNENEHVGVIGPNGAGKTTLFKVLCGMDELDSGSVVKSSTLRLGYLAQEENWHSADTAESILSQGFRLPIWELKSLGRKLGLTEELWTKPITSLSGGYRMRIKLLTMLAAEPNLMLLDEPTNYLDLETVLVLESFLQSYSGAFLLISHDREFLRRVTDHVIEVEGGDIAKYPGNIDDYFEQKQELREQLEKRALSVENKRSEVLKFAARFGAKATKARQAQSRLRSLDKLEKIEIKALPVRAAIRIPEPERSGEVSFRFSDVTLGYGNKIILNGINISIARGDHVAVIGLNGAGKSTLLKTFADELQPLTGKIEKGINVEVGYFAQHVSERLLPNESIFDALTRFSSRETTRQDILDLAGSLLFSGDTVNRQIKNLSGGEKSRVALGQILLKRAACLVLDEPTNHLDFDTVEALTQALQKFPGTLILVSHDRGFVTRVAKKIVEVKDGEAHVYPGHYDDYVWSLQKGMMAQVDSDATPKTSSSRERSVAEGALSWEQKKELQKKLRTLEKTIAQNELEMQKLQAAMDALSHELATATGVRVGELGKQLSLLQRQMSQVETEWLNAFEEKESLNENNSI